jgi:Protein of unknown function (DUF2934)
MSRESEIAMGHAFAPSDIGKNIDRRSYPTHDEIAQVAYSLYESRGRQEGHHSKIGCVPNRNSYITTRNCEVPH